MAFVDHRGYRENRPSPGVGALINGDLVLLQRYQNAVDQRVHEA